jgi:hypothetical protein
MIAKKEIIDSFNVAVKEEVEYDLLITVMQGEGIWITLNELTSGTSVTFTPPSLDGSDLIQEAFNRGGVKEAHKEMFNNFAESFKEINGWEEQYINLVKESMMKESYEFLKQYI